LAGDDIVSSAGSRRIQVPVTLVRRIKLPDTIKYTKEKGYDIRPGDVVSVARGPEYQRMGVVRSVDFPNARLTFLCDSDHSLIDVPITFAIKKRDANLDSFNNVIGREVFIVGGELKGYRATLYDIASNTCTIIVHGRTRTTLKRQDVVTSYGKRLNGAMLEGPDLVSFCDIRKRSYTTTTQHRSITPPPVQPPSGSADDSLSPVAPSSSKFDPWIINPEDI
ncbi:hypothetical protein CY34DRAFT_65333, partial [Suillus luteus UH-Slu-Lm8-n1]